MRISAGNGRVHDSEGRGLAACSSNKKTDHFLNPTVWSVRPGCTLCHYLEQRLLANNTKQTLFLRSKGPTASVSKCQTSDRPMPAPYKFRGRSRDAAVPHAVNDGDGVFLWFTLGVLANVSDNRHGLLSSPTLEAQGRTARVTTFAIVAFLAFLSNLDMVSRRAAWKGFTNWPGETCNRTA